MRVPISIRIDGARVVALPSSVCWVRLFVMWFLGMFAGEIGFRLGLACFVSPSAADVYKYRHCIKRDTHPTPQGIY